MRLVIALSLGMFWIAGASAQSVPPSPSTGPLVGPGVTGQKLPNGETVGADIGAGPHLERDLRPAPREADEELPAADRPTTRDEKGGSASTGSSRGDSSVGSSGADNDAIERDEDRATRNKDKFKRRPGYKEDVPLPRASK